MPDLQVPALLIDILAAPEVIIAAAAERTKRIMLGSGVTSCRITIRCWWPIASSCSTT